MIQKAITSQVYFLLLAFITRIAAKSFLVKTVNNTFLVETAEKNVLMKSVDKSNIQSTRGAKQLTYKNNKILKKEKGSDYANGLNKSDANVVSKRDYYSGLDMDFDPNPEPEPKKMKNKNGKNGKEKKKKRFFKKARHEPQIENSN